MITFVIDLIEGFYIHANPYNLIIDIMFNILHTYDFTLKKKNRSNQSLRTMQEPCSEEEKIKKGQI